MSTLYEPTEVAVVYAGMEPPEWWDAALFLAGPTPRSPDVASWRPQAVELLRELWQGPGRLAVFVPETQAGGMPHGWDAQVAWEDAGLHLSDVIVFWVPRDLATLPGFTTNVEWGRWEGSGRAVLGAPPDAPGLRYLRHYAQVHGVPVAGTLAATLLAALAAITPGQRRAQAHRRLPLPLWRDAAVRTWLAAQEGAGNRLRSARVAWTWPGPDGRPFFWAAHVAVEVAAEGRIKDNEVVLGRPDISVVVAYLPAPRTADTKIVLVREFRSGAVTTDGYVHELPGGSTRPGTGPVDPLATAVAELAEETGLRVAPARLRPHGARQVAATLSAHRVHLFSVELTEAELDGLAAGPREHGVTADGERTTVEITTYGELLACPDVDWGTAGLVTTALR
ncbi:nucleoside 2-deoxyribosyltransferase domain-containing protein [Catellatospora sp. KI3]|uniref:nucleoside 2-deoxyribosyltransferase domain-containing protein n=1 Tax=Catellatospora sp. KI3 TaxID=3041620 RepID=UPI0024822596|nr:nucleoside 2-deoxyribosyltransferase domain-containing protein [Catellatospora sp. KI3]MDI1465284.1 nucleoside 2-deoxyribosyltransferase domain-containing protein [Catellatospora sp. KI3]